MPKKRLKVYGTARIMKRENWKHKYRAVSRDRKGRFKTWRKWSPKMPIEVKKAYLERYVEAPTGKEVYEKVKEEIEMWKWIKYEVESP